MFSISIIKTNDKEFLAFVNNPFGVKSTVLKDGTEVSILTLKEYKNMEHLCSKPLKEVEQAWYINHVLDVSNLKEASLNEINKINMLTDALRAKLLKVVRYSDEYTALPPQLKRLFGFDDLKRIAKATAKRDELHNKVVQAEIQKLEKEREFVSKLNEIEKRIMGCDDPETLKSFITKREILIKKYNEEAK